MTNTAPWKLGEDNQHYPLDALADFTFALLQLLPQTRRSIIIQAPELDTPWLGNPLIADHITRLLRGTPSFRLQLLFNDSATARRQGHALIRLSQRFPSFIELRKAQLEDQQTASWLTLDQRALIQREDPLRFHAGSVCPNVPHAARHLLKGFEERWQRAQPGPQLRRLFL